MKTFRYPYREKKHRLDSVIYGGRIVVSFTLCVQDRKELFISDFMLISLSYIVGRTKN